MEEEVKTNFFTKALAWIKKNWIIIASVVAVIVVAIVLLGMLRGGPKKAVKQFVSGMSSKNSTKTIKAIDVIGMETWGYYYNEDDFSEDDYKEFIENYKKIDEEEAKNSKEYFEKTLKELFKKMDEEYKKFKMKTEEIKSVKKIGKDLYVVKAKVLTYAEPKDEEETDEIDESEIATFVVYKNKLISIGGIM